MTNSLKKTNKLVKLSQYGSLPIPVSSFIQPFCIYYKVSKTSIIPQGSIDNAVITNDNKVICKIPSNSFGGNWKIKDIFYAFSPLIRPYPKSVKLICCYINQEFPYNLIDIEVAPDPFNIPKKNIKFMIYLKSVPNTIPLYFYYFKQKNGLLSRNQLLPSFENPTQFSKRIQGDKKDIEIVQHILSPIYVLDSKKFIRKNNEIPKFLFSMSSGRCIPDPKGVNFVDCLSNNNTPYFNKNTENNSNNILEFIKTRDPERINKKNLEKIAKRKSPNFLGVNQISVKKTKDKNKFFIIFFTILLFISIFIIIAILLR